MDRRERKKTLCVYDNDNERKKRKGRAQHSPPLHTSFYVSLLVALGEFLFEVGEGEAHLLGEHEEVIE